MGAVPGRRPTNSPPVSVGSLLAMLCRRGRHTRPRPAQYGGSARGPTKLSDALYTSYVGPAPQAEYSLSISAAYLSRTTLRLTFMVGVSSPVGWEKSSGRIVNVLICSTRPTRALAASTAF